MLYPFTFKPILKERVWGGHKLAELYGKPLPPDTLIGESWEICDRAEEISVIENGPLAGRDLHWVLERNERDLLGDAATCNGRFPLLIKILDAREKLSLQVHPPAAMASELGGDPKTEMWYIADADPGAELYVGLRKEISRSEFETKVESGQVSDCFHRIPVKSGDAMFLPSGRVHAIGSGLVIFEVQENSDTTYRVFDWNRVGLDGKPRQLHVRESLASIDFNDYEPALLQSSVFRRGPIQEERLVNDLLFTVSFLKLPSGTTLSFDSNRMQICGLLAGHAMGASSILKQSIKPGGFCLFPASLRDAHIQAVTDIQLLHITANQSQSH